MAELRSLKRTQATPPEKTRRQQLAFAHPLGDLATGQKRAAAFRCWAIAHNHTKDRRFRDGVVSRANPRDCGATR
jgi:hypothetical protein